MNLRSEKRHIFCVFILAFWLFLFLQTPVKADLSSEITARTQQIEELQRQVDEYQRQIDATHSISSNLQEEINKLNAKIGQLNSQIKSLEISIDRAGLEIQDVEAKTQAAQKELDGHVAALGQYMRITNDNDQKTLTEVILKNGTLSEFFNELNSVQRTQESLRVTIQSINQLKDDLGEKQDDLENRKSDLEKLRGIQEIERRSLDGDKSVKNNVLKETKGQESRYQELVKKSTLDINRLKEQIYYLQQNGISAEDAVKYAQLAAIRVGIRPAFLLALLEVESRLGQNVGTGTWQNDMYDCYYRLSKIAKTADRRQYYINRAEAEKSAFFEVINGLGLNADTVKVSREPNYGCGGAMGPAQFIPTTWLGYAARVTELTGHNPPNPWNVEDAFTASAIKLAQAGATSKTRDGEIGAAKAYVGGSRTCSSAICRSYSAAVLRKAAEIEQDL